jgi:hypothetical protein
MPERRYSEVLLLLCQQHKERVRSFLIETMDGAQLPPSHPLSTPYSSQETRYKTVSKDQSGILALVFCPAKASTAGAPAASSEAIFPSVSTSTAIGVPVAPNSLPTLMPF